MCLSTSMKMIIKPNNPLTPKASKFLGAVPPGGMRPEKVNYDREFQASNDGVAARCSGGNAAYLRATTQRGSLNAKSVYIAYTLAARMAVRKERPQDNGI